MRQAINAANGSAGRPLLSSVQERPFGGPHVLAQTHWEDRQDTQTPLRSAPAGQAGAGLYVQPLAQQSSPVR
jgi:hypothetical protein